MLLSERQGEAEPLLAEGTQSEDAHVSRSKRPSPYWLVPVVMVFSIARGISMAPRIQVYNDIACRVLDIGADTCAKSPDVQARAARIQASITTIMSVLSALATGPWSRWGDYHGRKPLLFLTIVGALAMEIVYLLVTRENTPFYDHAEQFIMLGPILDGFFGGLSAFNGVVHAYTSDCTEHGSRSKIFSTLQGVLFVGLAIGPWIGGIALSLGPKSPDPYVLFYMSNALLVLLLCFVGLVCPESIDLEYAHLNRNSSIGSNTHHNKSVVALLRNFIIELFAGLLTPFTIFIPRHISGSARSGRDWNLTFIGAALFLYLISIGVYPLKYLYGKHEYQWDAEKLGYYMSLLWITRALNLLVVLPLIISYFKPKGQNGERASIWAEMQFDNILAQVSLFIDGMADALIAIVPSSSMPAFVVFSCLTSFTSGGNPTLHSLGAVSLHASGRSSEVGSLFGAMAVLSAIAHVISPTVFASTYASTVATFPKAIFVLAACLLGTAVILLSLLRMRGRGVLLPA